MSTRTRSVLARRPARSFTVSGRAIGLLASSENASTNWASFAPRGNATIHDEQTFWNGLISVLTTGIYTPTTVTIRCSTGQSAQLQLSRKEIVSILTASAFRKRLETVLPGRLREVESGIEALEEDLADAFVDG